MIAADSQGGREDGPIASYSDRKVRRFSNGDIAGCIGGEQEAVEFHNWYEDGEEYEQRPELQEGYFAAIVLTSDGLLYKYWHGCIAVEVFEDTVAMGTGDAVAYGAMDAGATPAEAVRIACRRDMYTGPPVVVEYIEG